MDSIRYHSPFARFVGQALREEAYTVVDVGCAGGLPPGWRDFGPRLRALGLDSNPDGVAALSAAEDNPQVLYRAAFVDGAGSSGPRNNPWPRLAVEWWLALNRRQAPGVQTAPEKPASVPTVALAEALDAGGLTGVDFLKIDVDGPDFGILASIAPRLGDLGVLGVGVEVNFIGSGAPDEHSFHNTDRMLRAAGFDLFDLSTRRYSTRALPGRSRHAYPAETLFGRMLQGDAIYFRDLCAPHNAEEAANCSAEQLAKLAASFALFGLPDCAAEVLTLFRGRLSPWLDVDLGLDLLALQAQEGDPEPVGYGDYVAAFEAGDAYFRLGDGPPGGTSPVSPDPAPYRWRDRVIHAGAACDEAGMIVTAPGRWSWALEVPLRRGACPPGAPIRLVVEAQVDAGLAGVGLLNRDRSDFHQETPVRAGESPARILLQAGNAEEADALMVRNLSPDGSPTRLRLRLVEAEAPPPPSGAWPAPPRI